MSGLFGGGQPSAPAPVPAVDDAAAQQAQADAARAAIAARNAAGRQSTIAAGGSIAAEDQYNRGLLSQKRRQAAQDILG